MSVSESINDFLGKIKLKDALILLLMFLLSLMSFQLGVLQGAQLSQKPIILTEKELEAIQPDISIKTVFASKKGSRYYYFWCSGGRNIKKSNRIYFKNAQDAEKTGYVLSKTCEK